MSAINIQIYHVFREANYLADFIANLAINEAECKSFWSFMELPSAARRIVNTNKY